MLELLYTHDTPKRTKDAATAQGLFCNQGVNTLIALSTWSNSKLI